MRTDPPRDPRRPKPGYWLVPLVAKGWAVPARLDLVDGIYSLVLDGTQIDETWTEEQLEILIADYLMGNEVRLIARLAMFGRRCSEAEYLYRLAIKAHSIANRIAHPCLTPRQPMRAGFISPALHFPE